MSMLILILAFAGFLEFLVYGTASIWLVTVAAVLTSAAVKLAVKNHD